MVTLLYGVVRPSRAPTSCGFLILLLASSLGAASQESARRRRDPLPAFPLEPAWTLTLDTQPAAPAVMDAERIYLPVQDGGLLALHRDSGRRAWRADLVSRWPAVLAGAVVAAASHEGVEAFEPVSGTPRWHTPLGALAAPLVADATLLIAITDSGEVVALHPDTGAVQWRQPLGTPSAHRPALGDVVLVVLAPSRVVALDRVTGVVRWTRELPGTAAAPALLHGLALIGTSRHRLHALQAATGRDAWTWRVGGEVAGAAADERQIYFATLDNVLHAVARGSGNQQWKSLTAGRPAGAPVIVDGAVVVAGAASKLEAFISRTGKVQGTYAATADLLGQPLIDPAATTQIAVVVVGRDGRITALRSEKRQMRDPVPTPLRELPGRRLSRERLRPPA